MTASRNEEQSTHSFHKVERVVAMCACCTRVVEDDYVTNTHDAEIIGRLWGYHGRRREHLRGDDNRCVHSTLSNHREIGIKRIDGRCVFLAFRSVSSAVNYKQQLHSLL